MKTLNEQIERLRELVRKCYGVVVSKGGEIPEAGERTMENLPATMESIPQTIGSTLQELTITANGEYTPQDGVDGFSKVIAEFDTSSLPKIKVATFQVNNNCINDDGIWEGESLIDTSECFTLNGCCENTGYLKEINANNWDVSNVTSLQDAFFRCVGLQKVYADNWNTSKVTSMYDTFGYCTNLQLIYMSNWDTSKVTNMNTTFRNCYLLSHLDISNWDASSVTTIYDTFGSCPSLQSLIGNRTIDDVLENNMTALNGLKVSLSLNQTILDRASLRAVINGLADLTGQTAQTLTLGATLIAKLTEEDIAIATNKNWTLL